MTGPEDPGDWGFPEVDPAGPASTSLPPPEPAPETGYDTGSDAWWRAQAQAQREAARTDPAVPPAEVVEPAPVEVPELVEPQVLLPEPAVTPLDSAWSPPDLPELHAPAPEEPAPVEPEVVELEVVEPEPVEPEVVAAPVTRALPPRATRPAPAAEAPPAPEPPAAAEVVPPPLPVDVTDPHGFAPVPPVASSYEDEVPRARTAPEPERVGPARALAGAALAVAGVALGIGALLLLGDDEPQGTPTVALPPATVVASAEPTVDPTVAPTPTVSASPAAVVPTAAATEAPTSAAPVPKVVVAVLNNSRVSRLADRTADRLRAGGWPVGTVGNYSGGTIRETTVYYAEGQLAAAQELARTFGVPRVLPRFAGLPTKGMTLVVTRDFA